MEEFLEDIILLDEDGEANHFRHLLTFDYENARFIALAPLPEQEDEDEEEVVILQVKQVDGEDVYVTVESEVLLEEAFDRFLDLMDEIEEEQDE